MTTTTKLSATQESLLKTAAGCDDRAIRWPATLRGGARTKIILALVAAGLAENRNGTLVITDAGMRAVGVEPKVERPAEREAAPAAKRGRRAKQPAAAGEPRERRAREGTKQALMIDMLRRPGGATIDEIAEATHWQRHTIRGAMAGALKKKLGLTIESEKIEGRGRTYRIIGA